MEDNRTLDQIYRAAVSGLYARLRSNYDFLCQKFGEEGLLLIAEMSRAYGLTIAARAKKRLPDNSLKSVSEYLLRIFNTVSYGKYSQRDIEFNADSVVIRVSECPLHFDSPAMCRAHTTMEKTVVEELNPRLTYCIGKSLPSGDSYCEHIIRYKTPAEKSPVIAEFRFAR